MPKAGEFSLGSLKSVPVADERGLVAPVTLSALLRLGWQGRAGVVEIDPTFSDTANCQEAYGLPPASLVNCVVVSGKREGVEHFAACAVPATTRSDVNGAVRRRLNVRKASFLPLERAVGLTGMEPGAINPIGLPEGWLILVDARVVATPVVLMGSGLRRSKLLLAGRDLQELPGAEVVEGLGL
jgi:prolyl-tRNA editing enzyme YbaK/EbsC (Cys-tRNA(Pro) deacylase)